VTEGKIVVLHGFIEKTQKTPDEDLRLARRRRRESEPSGIPMTAPRPARSTQDFATLDDFLESEGTREAFQAVAIKELLVWQIEQAMKQQHLSRTRLAQRMGTSRSQINRLLDPTDGNVTLLTLQRAAEMIGRKVRLELV
jgi:predicted XRE-type DNA-binding protein